jgi:hypothetical protein
MNDGAQCNQCVSIPAASCAENDHYSAVKRVCDVELGVQSQVLVAPNMGLGQGGGQRVSRGRLLQSCNTRMQHLGIYFSRALPALVPQVSASVLHTVTGVAGMPQTILARGPRGAGLRHCTGGVLIGCLVHQLR